MQTILSNISNKQKLTKEETIPGVPAESITPERVRRGFERWKKLGKQDPTESIEQSESLEEDEDSKGE